MVGSGALAVAGLFADLSDRRLAAGRPSRSCSSTVVHLLMLALEYAGRHASRQATVAAHIVTSGRYARLFWLGAVAPAAAAAVLGALTWGGMPVALLALAGLVVQPALVAYESVFVRAGQDPPLS